jgi:hypothetical protein
MKDIKEYILESKSYVNNITNEGPNKITITNYLDGDDNTFEVNVKFFTKPKNNRQAIIVDLGNDVYVDFFKNGNFTWDLLTYFDDDEDPKETWKDNEFAGKPEWFTKDKLPKSFDDLEKILSKNKI